MSYTFIQGNLKHTSGANGEITRIVIHATVSACKVGGAREVARYFQSDNAGGLAHYVVDPTEIVQCCKDDTACWHAPPNRGSLGIELCDPQAGTVSRWADSDHEKMLHLAATLVAELAKVHSVPVVYVDAAGLKAGKHGITAHHEVSKAFGQSDHSDPDHAGAFPWDHFLQLVHTAGGGAGAPAHPAAAPRVKTYPTLRQGSTGADVKRLQGLVHATADGQYGPGTAKAVEAAQKAHKLTVDGVAGPATLKALGW